MGAAAFDLRGPDGVREEQAGTDGAAFRRWTSRRPCLTPMVRACSGICFQGRRRSSLRGFFRLPLTTRR